MPTVTLEKRRGRYRAIGNAALKNNLLAGVGYLELANAGDFAANVWNEIPVPRHAVILMAIGGPIALLVSLVAARDFYLSRGNVSLLSAERKALLSVSHRDDKTSAVLGVNARELGTEAIDRMLMDALLGFGALLVGTGTIMAIFGANPKVYLASNLLSGFVGNGFAAIFGIVNAIWSAYLVYHFQARYTACLADPDVQTIQTKLRQRFRRFQWHAATNGINGLVAAMASMVTAKMWWGYVVLIPCVAIMIASNLFWKWKLGYNRPIRENLFDELLDGDKSAQEAAVDDILESMVGVEVARDALQGLATVSLEALLNFIDENNLLESFCEYLAAEWPDHSLFTAETVVLSKEDLMRRTDETAQMEKISRQFLDQNASKLLEHRERYLLELVGEAVFRTRSTI
ncbi:hypothetical protein BDV18DRAFT_154524 [Aspergillus unguis]